MCACAAGEIRPAQFSYSSVVRTKFFMMSPFRSGMFQATNLIIWDPLSTNPLVNGVYVFSDPAYTNYPNRFYRVRSP